MNRLLATFTFLALTITLTAAQIYLAYASLGLMTIDLTGLFLFNIWLIAVGIIDIRTKIIPLWLTAPVIIIGLSLAFATQVPQESFLLHLRITPIKSAFGICIGYILLDIVTHLGNWLKKFPAQSQGIIPLWASIPTMIVFSFLPTLPLWAAPIGVLVFRVALEYFNYSSQFGKSIVNFLLKTPWLGYFAIFGLLFTTGYYEAWNPAPFYAVPAMIYALTAAFILEELIIPIAVKFGLLSENSDSADDEHCPTVMGGADASLTACLGSFLGPAPLPWSLLIAFISAFACSMLLRLKKLLLKDEQLPLELPFGPFIVLGGQAVILIDHLTEYGHYHFNLL